MTSLSRGGDTVVASRSPSSIPSRDPPPVVAGPAREGFGTSSYRTTAVSEAPGAGAYDLGGSLVLPTGTSVGTRGFGALASAAPRLPRDSGDARSNPGPGAYAARDPNARRGSFNRAPATASFHRPVDDAAPAARARSKLPPQSTPGPTTYAPERAMPPTKLGAGEAAFRDGVRRFGLSASDDADAPGDSGPSPASYAVLDTRYRTSFNASDPRASANASRKLVTASEKRTAGSSSFRGPTPKPPRRSGVSTVAGAAVHSRVAFEREEEKRNGSHAADDKLKRPRAPAPGGYSCFAMRHDAAGAPGVGSGRVGSKRGGAAAEAGLGATDASALGFSCARAEPKTPTRRAAPPKMPTITGGAEIVEFYDRNERAFARRGAGE